MKLLVIIRDDLSHDTVRTWSYQEHRPQGLWHRGKHLIVNKCPDLNVNTGKSISISIFM